VKQIYLSGYTITAVAVPDQREWCSQAAVSWQQQRRHHTAKLEFTSRFPTEDEAEEHALTLGRDWVNKRLCLKRSRRIVIRRN
jgi:hypothetical protein